MAKVGIVMGSDSDMPVMKKAADMLEKFGIEYEMRSSQPTENRTYSLSTQRQRRKKISKSSLQVQEWQLTFQACVQRFSPCR